MRSIDEIGLKLCKIQANIFEASATRADCSSSIFLRRFMYSAVASRMDSEGFLYESCDLSNVFEEIDLEFGPTAYGQTKFAAEELYWIGYLYRYWCYTYQKTSKQVYKIIKPAELRDLYFPYHSLDPAQAIDRILEAKGLREEDTIQRGVQILRRLMNQK